MVEQAEIDTRKTGYPIRFSRAPKIGTRIVYWGGHEATLISVEDYTRKSGEASKILVWSVGAEERVGTSGLRSKAMTWRAAQ